MIRVLVVDDSLVMRKAISRILERADDMTVVDTAANGVDGVEKARRLEPDVVTMDVEMPKMNGIEAVRHIMETSPRPILMLSSLTEKGAEVTIKAMRAGAADFVPKGGSTATLRTGDVESKLVEKVRALAQSDAQLFEEDAATAGGAREARKGGRSASAAPRAGASYELAVIGVSTGGPMALQHVLPDLPADFPVPVAVVQHMPPQFTRSLADRLDALSALDVAEAAEGMRLQAGQVVIAAGDRHLAFERREGMLVARTPNTPRDEAHRPSVNVMFQSAVEACRDDVLALVMTGMGSDGLEGVQQVKDSGGTVYVQDKDTSVVYGMPRVVSEAGLADDVFALDALAGAMQNAVGAPARP